VPWGKFPCLGVDGVGGGHKAEREIELQRIRGQPTRNQVGLGRSRELRGEPGVAPRGAKVQRLDPKRISHENDLSPAHIGDGKGEDSVQTAKEPNSPLLPAVHERFRVAMGSVNVTAGLELASQFDVVVDLSIEDDPDSSVLVGHRLGAAFEIDDAEPTVPQHDVGRLREFLPFTEGRSIACEPPESHPIRPAMG
jgi:hypothetical protein